MNTPPLIDLWEALGREIAQRAADGHYPTIYQREEMLSLRQRLTEAGYEIDPSRSGWPTWKEASA